MSGSELLLEERHGAVALLRLDRPEARNALSPELMVELGDALERLDSDPGARAIVIAGSDEVFAAGADIRSLRERDFSEVAVSPGSRLLEAGLRLSDSADRRQSPDSLSAAVASLRSPAT